MTILDAKKELKPIKEKEKDIKAVELEIERLMAVATKMTTGYSPINISGTPENRLENALMEIEDYRGRLSSILIEHIKYKNKCLEKVRMIEPVHLQKVLIYYYFNDFTLEKTAELLELSYQGTYNMFRRALSKYCRISEKNSFS